MRYYQTDNQRSQPQNKGTNNQPNGAKPKAEPAAGQQTNEWQQKLMNAREEMIQWAQQHGITLSQEITNLWEQSMMKGDQAAYDNFMQAWNVYKNNPSPTNTYGGTGQQMENPEPWKVAIINQIQGQTVIANTLKLNIGNELNNLMNNLVNSDLSAIESTLKLLMEKWNQINSEINKRSQTVNINRRR